MSVFPRGTVMQWSTDGLTNSTKVRITDHGRDSLVATPNRIESKARTWEGTLRKNVVATKYSYSCNWTFVPTLMSKLADYDASNPTLTYSAKEIKAFYAATIGPFVLTLLYDGTPTTVNVMISSFSYTVVKRTTATGSYDLVDMSIELEEV